MNFCRFTFPKLMEVLLILHFVQPIVLNVISFIQVCSPRQIIFLNFGWGTHNGQRDNYFLFRFIFATTQYKRLFSSFTSRYLNLNLHLFVFKAHKVFLKCGASASLKLESLKINLQLISCSLSNFRLHISLPFRSLCRRLTPVGIHSPLPLFQFPILPFSPPAIHFSPIIFGPSASKNIPLTDLRRRFATLSIPIPIPPTHLSPTPKGH